MHEPHVSDQNLSKLGMSGLKKTAFYVLFDDEKGRGRIFGIRVIYGHSHIYLNPGCKIQVSDLASFVDVIDAHLYFWCHPLFLIFYPHRERVSSDLP